MRSKSRVSELRSVYALCDDGLATHLPIIEKVEALLRGGVQALQLRLKKTPSAQAVPLCRSVVERCRRAGVVCLINDRVDWALLSGADGVHLGEDDLPVAEARAVLGPDAVIGATVRGLSDAQRAAKSGASYVGLGPIFETRTKAVSCAPLGLETLEQVVRQGPLPVVAIAGIGLHNIAQVAATGAQAAAIGSALLDAPDIAAQARALHEAFERGAAAGGRGGKAPGAGA